MEGPTAAGYQSIRKLAITIAVQVPDDTIVYLVYQFTCVLCIVNGGWSSWTVAKECTKTCGGGISIMRRSCNSPSPYCGGQRCSGIDRKEVPCNTQCCQGKTNLRMMLVFINVLLC